MTTISWKAGNNGDWGTAADWNGGAVPGAANDVNIAATGTYTVTINEAQAAHSLAINAANATVSDNSSLTIGTTLTLSAGTFSLASSGDLIGGTVKVGSQGHFQFGGGTLTGVTWLGSLTFGASQSLSINDGLSVPGASGSGNGTINLSAGNDTLYVLDTETLNNATLTFGSGSNGSLDTYDQSSNASQTLTLGSGFTVSQTGGSNALGDGYYSETLVNDGLISVSGGTFSVNNAAFSNAGSIALSGGLFQVASGIASSGTISVTGGTFDLTTSLAGSGTLALSSKGVLELGSSAVLSGTVASSGGTFDPGSGTLSAVAWQGPLVLAASQTVSIENGVSVTGTGGTGSGTINLSAGNDTLFVLDTETLNNATLTFGSGVNGSLETYDTSSNASQTLTLGSGFTVTQTGGSNALGDGYYGETLVNDGLISVSGGTLNVYNAEFSNAGSIALSGGELNLLTNSENSGTIAVTGGTLGLQTTLTGTGAVAVSGSGVFELDSSGVLSGTITPGGGTFDFNGGTLSAATWHGPLTVGTSQSVYLENGLSVTGTSGSGNGTINLSASNTSLFVLDTETLNNATLTFGSGAYDTLWVYGSSSTQTVTLGSGFTLTQAGGSNTLQGYYSAYFGNLVNAGLISVSGGTLNEVNLTTFANTGTISTAGGTFSASSAIFTNSGAILLSTGVFSEGAGTFTNTGSIAISGGTFDLDSGVSSNTGSIAVTGGTLDLQGTLTSPGALSVGSAGVFELESSGFLSGTVTPGGGTFDFNGGTLSAATWHGPLTVGASQSVYVENGLSVTGTSGSGNGTINLSAGSASLFVLDTETLNNATLTFGSGNNDYLWVYGSSSTQTVTFGSGFTLTQAGGTNALEGYYSTYFGNLVNAGLIYVSGGTLNEVNLTTFANTGTISIAGGTFSASSTIFTNSGAILLSTGVFTEGAGTFTNTGSIAISGGIFDLDSGVSSNTGSIAVTGGTLDLQGTLTSPGALSVGSAGVFELDSSGLLSGTITPGGGTFDFNGGTLSAATWHGPLTVGVSQSVYVENGLSVTGTSGSGNGTINLSAGSASLFVLDTETLNNATLTFGSGTYDYLWVYGASSTQTVTLGSGFTLTEAGGNNYLSGDYDGYYGNLVNAGLISLSGGALDAFSLTTFANTGTISVTGGTFTASSINTFTSTGLIALSSGGTLDLSGVTKFADLAGTTLGGTYSIGSASVLELATNAFVSTITGKLTLSGAGSSIQSYNSSTGTQLTLDSKLTTIAAGGMLSIGAGRNFSGAAAFADNGTITLAGSSFTEKSVTIAAAASFSGTGTLTGTLTNNGKIEATGRALVLASAVSGTGALQIDSGATLEVKSSSSVGETATFGGIGATLKLDTPASFASIISGLAPGNVIDFVKTTLTSVSSTGTLLRAVSASGTTTLTLAAALANEHLGLSSDGNGGTDVTAYGLAQSSAHVPEPVALGNHHVGDTNVSTALTLSNTAPNSGYYENLDAGIGNASGGATASGSFTGLAPQSSNSSSLLIGLNTTASGSITGQAVISLFSDGAGIDGATQTSIGTQIVNVSGDVYAYAQASLANNGTVTLANTHVGQAVSGQLVVTNGATANGYSEALDVSITPAAPFTGVGSLSALAAGRSGTLSVGYSGGAAGTYSGTEMLGLVSDGTAIGDGLGTTTLTSQTVTVTGASYAYASGTLASSSINLGVVHVQQADTAALTITNGAAANQYSEALDAGLSGAAGGVTTSGSLSGLAAGATDMSSLQVGLITTTSGSFSGSALLNLVSDGNTIHDGLGTTSLGSQTIIVSGIVDNYAVAAFQDPAGPAISGSGTQYSLSLGNVVQGSAADVLSLGVLNAATGLSDLLQGTISSAGGSGFTNTGFGTFGGLGAGQGEHSQSVTLATSTAGTFSETILLSSSGTNASGYNGALATETLTVTGVITPVGSTTYTLSAGPNTVTGADGGDLFVAPTYSLNSRDSLTGGTGANVIQLRGGGQFDLGAPKVFANIPTVTAYEGQLGSGAVASTQQMVFLRDGSNETLNVVAGTAAKGDTNPESIIIYSSAATNTINLASGSDQVFLATGNDTVVLGGAKNSVVAGGGTALVQSTAADAGAAVAGTTTGSTVLQITNAGTVTLNAADTYLTVQLEGKTRLTLDKLQFITANGGNGGDTIIAGAANQTLIGGAADMLTGYSGGSDLFSGATAALNGDTIGNWTTGDSIDLTDMSTSATLSYAGNTKSGKLTVTSGSLKSVISFTGDYTLNNFAKPVTDGHGGALISYVG